MARPTSKKLPHLSKLINFILSECLSKKELKYSKIEIVNFIFNAILHDNISPELKEWKNKRIKKLQRSYPGRQTWYYSPSSVTCIIKGNKFIDYRIIEYYKDEIKSGRVRENIRSIKDKLNNSPLITRNLCRKIIGYFKKEENNTPVINGDQLAALSQSEDYCEIVAIVLFHISSDMTPTRFCIRPSQNMQNILLDEIEIPFVDDMTNSLENGNYLQNLELDIIIKPDFKNKIFSVDSTVKYKTRWLSESFDNSIQFEFGFETKELREQHKIERLIVNDIDYSENIKKPKLFQMYSANGRPYRKKYMVEISRDTQYVIKRVTRSILQFPIGEIIYRAPKPVEGLKICISLDYGEDESRLCNLTGNFFAPLDIELVRDFTNRHKNKLEVEIQEILPKGVGYHAMIFPHTALLEFKPGNIMDIFKIDRLEISEDDESTIWD